MKYAHHINLKINVTFKICVIWLLSLSMTGGITWTLQENPAIFGTNIHLVCHLPNDTTCCNDYRKWNAGNQYILIITNGLSYNTSKYKDDLITKDQVSILTIFSFSEEDVNIPYECVYGFQNYRSVLELKDDVFEFHPTEKLPVKPTVKGHTISFSVHFKRIFPKPLCQAELGAKNVSSLLRVNVTKQDLFYESSLAFSHTTSETTYKDSLTVVCIVGKTLITVVDYKSPHLSNGKVLLNIGTRFQRSAGDIKISSIIVASISVVAAIIIITVVVYWARQGKRNMCRRCPDNTNAAEKTTAENDKMLLGTIQD